MANDTLRILLLEDNPLDVENIDLELREADLTFSVMRIVSEESYRHELETSCHDVILADYNLQVFDGMKALEIARTMAPEVPFIFVSGSSGEERAVKALHDGASDYVMKDRLSRLAAAITRAIGERHERILRQRAREALLRITSLHRIAATVAHEFNNVLMGIQPFAEVIRRRANDDEKLNNAAVQIISSVTRGKRLTHEILRFSQPAEPTTRTIDTEEWLANLIPELRAMIGPRIELAVQLPREKVRIRGDALQLQQVLTNLVLNSRDAMPTGGKITITVSADRKLIGASAGMAVLSVHDTGAGMTPAEIENIFEPLFTTKRVAIGLGLAVAQQVVTRNGGSIHVESTPGVGTTFFITIPLTEASPVGIEVAAPHSALRLKRVLLVEDEPDVAAGIVALLEIEGIQVAVATRGAEAMPAAGAFRPEAVILDLGLPDMAGSEVYERLASRWPSLPVIFSTGHGDEAALQGYLTAPHVGFLRKPYDFNALITMLQKVTESVAESQRNPMPM